MSIKTVRVHFFTKHLEQKTAALDKALQEYEDAVRYLETTKQGAASGVMDDLFYRAHPEYASNRYRRSMGLIVLLPFIFMLTCLTGAFAAEIPADKAVTAILGEAENQGYEGMLAVAVGIRNRGTLQGVYGVNAKRPNTPGKIPARYWDMARRAWAESETNRIHNGDHWENINAFGKPSWAGSMQEVYRIRDHVFYKAVA